MQGEFCFYRNSRSEEYGPPDERGLSTFPSNTLGNSDFLVDDR